MCFEHECVPYGKKVQIGCHHDDICPKGTVCNNEKTCVVQCTRNNQCPPMYNCTNGRCTPRENIVCVHQEDCPAGFSCAAPGFCRQKCQFNPDCQTGKWTNILSLDFYNVICSSHVQGQLFFPIRYFFILKNYLGKVRCTLFSGCRR